MVLKQLSTSFVQFSPWGLMSEKYKQCISFLVNNFFLYQPLNEDWDVVEVCSLADADEVCKKDEYRSFGSWPVTLLVFSTPPKCKFYDLKMHKILHVQNTCICTME